jgi:thymidylate synthase|uniref:thymidylate synthase n=1 Tax=viral metagenome TaxID=1070528 RepID=A0A6C0IMG9_9ZZZZ
MSHPEQQYLQLIRDILERGHDHHGRNGDTKTLFGNMMRFPLKDGTVPLLTTKKVAWKTCFKELIWFIRGCTDNEDLQKQKVHIWDGNSTREFLDSRGLTQNEEGDLGPVYGHQWRHFNAEYVDRYTDYSGKGIDQLQYIIDNLKTEEGRASRRLIMSAWNPCQLDEMALPPCHVLAQFNVRSEGDKHYLSCALYQRSCDVGLGVPFNIASYSFLTHLIAKECDLIAEEFVYFMGNTHIYNDHIDALKIQITREPLPFPTMDIPNKKSLEDYQVADIVWKEEYKSHETIKMNMSA